MQELPVKPRTIFNDVFPEQVEWSEGYLLPTTKPDLGVEFDGEAAKKYPYKLSSSPLFFRQDGALTNW